MRWMFIQTATATAPAAPVIAVTYNGEVLTCSGELVTYGDSSVDISLVPLTAFSASVQTAIATKMPLLLPAVTVANGGTLAVERNNVLSTAATGTFVFPTMSDNDFLVVTSTTAYDKVLSCVASGRTFLEPGSTTNTTTTILAAERGPGWVFRAIPGNFIQMTGF